jgi:serine/threonine protein kinase
MSETSRVKIVTGEGGKSSLQFGRLVLYDTGLYKVVARNKNGSAVSRFKLFIGDGHRLTPEIQLSNLDYKIESNPVELSPGNPADDYPDLEVISRGSYSYLALSKSRNHMLQIVHKEVMDCNTELTKSLVNVNIANLISYNEVSPTLIYVKEYCGDLLLNYLSEQLDYSEETLCVVSGQVLDALTYLHWRGWVLMNLNPGNVVFDGQRAKLVDFTCSQQINSSILSGRNPQSLLEFNAPEQISSDGDTSVIPQTDIWGFGVLLYICLSGVSPFKGASTDETKQNIQFVRFRFEPLFKEITSEATKFFIQLFKRSPLKRPNIEECFDSRWFSPSEFMQKKRAKATFQGSYLKEYVEESKRNEAISEVIEKTIRTVVI